MGTHKKRHENRGANMGNRHIRGVIAGIAIIDADREDDNWTDAPDSATGLRVGAVVRHRHVYDGTSRAGKPVGGDIVVQRICYYDSRAPWTRRRELWAWLSDGTRAFVWNLLPVKGPVSTAEISTHE
jgi:hypothetical protein